MCFTGSYISMENLNIGLLERMYSELVDEYQYFLFLKDDFNKNIKEFYGLSDSELLEFLNEDESYISVFEEGAIKPYGDLHKSIIGFKERHLP